MEKQIEYREDLSRYYETQKEKAKRQYEVCEKLEDITNIQLEELYRLIELSKIPPIKHSNFKSINNSDKIMVIDINYLPSEYKENDLEDSRRYFENIYNTKIIFIDSSRCNLNGAESKNLSPIYYL